MIDVTAPSLALYGVPVAKNIRIGSTTYCYRTTGGTRGNTTAVASIPAGAVVERITTS